MRIPRIYLPVELKINDLIELSGQAFQHTIKVLRMKQNDQLIVFNGEGDEYAAHLDEIKKRSAFIKINDQIINNSESHLSIHLGLGISKGERMDYAIQKAVELGVNEITPLFTQHCVVNLDEKRLQKRLLHWQGVIISACEQSGRTKVPILHPAISLTQWSLKSDQICLVLDPLSEQNLSTIKAEIKNMRLLIGPEGGLSSGEITELNQKENVHTINFGPRILRTETAAVAAITAVQVLWGDLADK